MKTIPHTCDRCKAEDKTADESELPKGWLTVMLDLGGRGLNGDICAKCVDDILRFVTTNIKLRKKRKARKQASPAPGAELDAGTGLATTTGGAAASGTASPAPLDPVGDDAGEIPGFLKRTEAA